MSNPVDLLAPVWTHMTQVQPVRGEGIYLYDAAGKQYTDFTSGIGVTNTGHCHPRVVNAIQKPAAEVATKVQQACIQRNLLLLTCGTYGNVIRWIPPLVVNAAQIDAALGIFNEALATA